MLTWRWVPPEEVSDGAVLAFMLDMACGIQLVVGGAQSKLLGDRLLGSTESIRVPAKCVEVGDRGPVLKDNSLLHPEAMRGDGGRSGGVCEQKPIYHPLDIGEVWTVF